MTERIGKMRQTYLPPEHRCGCKKERVMLVNGILRCADCLGAYIPAGSYYYSDEFMRELIKDAPIFGTYTGEPIENIILPEKEEPGGREQKIRFPITYLQIYPAGGYLVRDKTTGEDRPVQVDYDFPSLARNFGWDGKILPKTQLRAVNIEDNDTTGAEIYSAIQWLDDNEGKVVEDPGYFDEE
jgi:hypothetical protein